MPGDLAALVDLAARARPEPGASPLLPARYHLFLRALEGAYVCLAEDHPAGARRLRLSRHRECPECSRPGHPSAMFELAVCRNCRAAYAVGRIPGRGEARRLEMAGDQEPPTHFVLLRESPAEEDADDPLEADRAIAGRETTRCALCPRCGLVANGSLDCGCGAGSVSGWMVAPKEAEEELTSCARCRSVRAGGVVARIQAGADAATATIATALYQELPAEPPGDGRPTPGGRRRLLCFSDSRQSAAFFAPYLERTYGRLVQRRLILRAARASSADGPPRAEDLLERVREEAERALVIDPDDSRQARRREVGLWIARELIASDWRQSLEGLGLLSIGVALPTGYRPPEPLRDLGLSESEIQHLLQLLLGTLRLQGAISVPEGVDRTNPELAPRDRAYGVRERRAAAGERTVIGWAPSVGRNRRLEILEKIWARRRLRGDPGDTLLGIWRYLTEPRSPWERRLRCEADPRRGPLWRLAWEGFEFRLAAEKHRPFLCSTCGRLTWWTVGGICPTWRCPGEVERVPPEWPRDEDHYRALYEELRPVALRAEEHTAQLTPDQAARIQSDFVDGEVNVLSCSTTFELGVDVGEVQAVLLRNVPPLAANYIQRAGRAGRRSDGVALAVTFAPRRSHDLSHFADPLRMVAGRIDPPSVFLENAYIVRRHLHSAALAAFLRQELSRAGGEPRSVEEFFMDPGKGAPTPCDRFVDWLRSRPEDLGEVLRRIVPRGLADPLDLEGWGWVERLVTHSADEPAGGWLTRAGEEIRGDLARLEELIQDAVAGRKFKAAHSYQRIRNTLARQNLLNYLAARNVLPKYGFPVDTVSLDVRGSGNDRGSGLDLSRDLRVAITEYAPGASVVAAKRLWKSVGLVVRRDRGVPKYAYAVCGDCGAYRQTLEPAGEHPCPVCRSPAPAPGRAGKFVVPVFGFVGSCEGDPGESRPRPPGFAERFFSSYGEDEGSFDELSHEELAFVEGLRLYRQGRISVVNRGARGRGFRLCETCGFGQAAPRSGTGGTTRHQTVAWRTRECRGRLSHVALGHSFLTDVLEIRPALGLGEEASRSLLYAVLRGAPAAGVVPDELSGTLAVHRRGADPAVVLYDDVPGGAGHVRRIAENLPGVIALALERVASCECGEETSCYTCLRSYSNQLYHEELSRGAARDALRRMLPTGSE